MFEQAFKNIDDVLWKEAGCTTELDYTEQTSWLLFLKYLDGLEQDLADEAALNGKTYTYILDTPYRWETWAAPKGKDGTLDHNTALTGDDLRDFVKQTLFPYLHGFKQRATGPNTIEYKIGEIFGEIKNKVQSGYNLREIIDHIDALRFRSQAEKHELSHLYEAKIRNMGNAGRNGGEYYTPRPLIRAIVQVVQPTLGERIYDGACGSAGFLCESYDYLTAIHPKRTTAQDRTLQERTFYGKEKKSLAYVIAIMNMILHGIEAPNILHTNTLSENLADIQEKDRYAVVLANPPFGGKERKEVQQNFPIRTGETAFLFLQHFIKILKAGGRAGVVIKNTFLSNTDNASVSLRKLLLEGCTLHPAHGARHARWHIPRCGREDGRAFLREGGTHAQSLVLPARPWPQPRQDKPAQRRRLGRVRDAPKDLRRLTQVVERGRHEHQQGDLRPVREEPQRARGNRVLVPVAVDSPRRSTGAMNAIDERACGKPGCDNFGKPGLNIVGHGWFVTTSGRRRRNRCTVCGGTLSTNTGTAYRGLRCSRREFDQVASLRVEGVSISATARVTGHSRPTIARWLERAATAAACFNHRLLRDFDVIELQADERCTFIGSKRRTLWLFATIEVCSRLWAGSVLGRRFHRNTKAAINDVILRGRRVGCPLIATDGVEYYVGVMVRLLGSACVYGQVLKTRRNTRVVRVERRVKIGTASRLNAALLASEDSETLNTSFLEPLNLTIRQGSAYLRRRSPCHARGADQLRSSAGTSSSCGATTISFGRTGR